MKRDGLNEKEYIKVPSTEVEEVPKKSLCRVTSKGTGGSILTLGDRTVKECREKKEDSSIVIDCKIYKMNKKE